MALVKLTVYVLKLLYLVEETSVMPVLACEVECNFEEIKHPSEQLLVLDLLIVQTKGVLQNLNRYLQQCLTHSYPVNLGTWLFAEVFGTLAEVEVCN